MANIPYVGEAGLKRALKGVVDWANAKFGEIKGIKLNNTAQTADSEGNVNLTVMEFLHQNQDNAERIPYAATITEPKKSNGEQNQIVFENNTNGINVKYQQPFGESKSTYYNHQLVNKNYVDNIFGNKAELYVDRNHEYDAVGSYCSIHQEINASNATLNISKTANGVSFSVEHDTGIQAGFSSVELPNETRVQSLINAGLGSISGVNFQVVQTLPATGVNGVFYLMANGEASGSNIYDEYVWVNKGTTESPNYAFERLGTMDVDLSGYVQATDMVPLTNDEVDAILVEIGAKASA